MASRTPRIAINGFGRIGRTIFRQVAQAADIEVVAVNDITANETIAYLTRYDTVHGRFPGTVTLHDGHMKAGTQDVLMLEEGDPPGLPWAKLGIDVVIEATGHFRKRAEIEKHLDAGAG